MRRRTAALALVGLWAGLWAVNRSLVAVRGPSMAPTLRAGERLLTVPARLVRLRPGLVVVAEDPGDAGHLVIKRIARLDGQGPEQRVLVLGDAPAASTDGRVWGPVDVGAVRRVALARWPSLSRAGLTGRDPAGTARQPVPLTPPTPLPGDDPGE